MVTLTPSSDVGRTPLTTSSVRQIRPGLVFARLVPLMVTHEPASKPAWKLAPLRTAVMFGPTVAAETTSVTGTVRGRSTAPAGTIFTAPGSRIGGRPGGTQHGEAGGP